MIGRILCNGMRENGSMSDLHMCACLRAYDALKLEGTEQGING
jgi:hypothetical protein